MKSHITQKLAESEMNLNGQCPEPSFLSHYTVLPKHQYGYIFDRGSVLRSRTKLNHDCVTLHK